ncbi:hypothetical protein AB7M49_003021 [Bradyrhizobium elkanii]|uniref:Uncharacterized protein n=1 Tax=Bradyrhizobium elkanii TaxID=29448 RepID=A0A8I2C3H8_BRAEL|nr:MULTISPECIES: hypothetical protein [Bradyrhizobium]MBP1291381.1 hypothetical protein [Bradyrhizobium elkanii]MCP1928308.1 hypothetical protein [Bradyrhizobium elkanii]MCS3474296.1 hypothetical protein [Bradyrhizobium elkanii]MCS3581080.1 hypothetical protein [Bradyrhizobium elkanii]MCS3723955.1 hypothetical protein [Bradyrhizobium elkanii]
MSKIQMGIFAALAAGLTLGAVQLASGHDLIGGQQVTTALAPESAVNRAAKTDRATAQVTGLPSRTVALKVERLPDTSVLVRVPVAREEARHRPAAAPARARPGDTRKVACEPVVSVLTEVAKLLQPGRCVT